MPKAMVSMPQVLRLDDRNQCEPTHEVGARIVASFPIDFCPTKSSAQPQRDDELLGRCRYFETTHPKPNWRMVSRLLPFVSTPMLYRNTAHLRN
jgi:hypothetical protein